MSDKFKKIEIENLTIAYQDKVVIDHFNLTLPSAGCVCFFGPSGSGKTTLLMALAGLKKPSEGRIRVQWREENPQNEKTKNEGTLPDIACVFQEDRLIPWLTALENVAFVVPKEKPSDPSIPESNQKQNKSNSPKKEFSIETAKKWLTKVGLQESMNLYPAQLSGGMKQRVNIARALSFDAPVLLLDEPFKGLDDTIKEQIMGIFQELKKDRLLILVTHDKEDVRLLADKIIPIE